MQCLIKVFIDEDLIAEYNSIEEMEAANLFFIDENEKRKIQPGDTYELRLNLRTDRKEKTLP